MVVLYSCTAHYNRFLRNCNAVFGAFQLCLQTAECIVSTQVGIIFCNNQQTTQCLRQFALVLPEIVQLFQVLSYQDLPHLGSGSSGFDYIFKGGLFKISFPFYCAY